MPTENDYFSDDEVSYQDDWELPRPLYRELASSQPFPVDMLPNILKDACLAIHEIVQCPLAIAGSSILAAAALAVQAHADIENPATHQRSPTSLFLITVGMSGERKTTADRFALAPIREYEHILKKSYDATYPDFQNKHQAWLAARNKAKNKKNADYGNIEAELKQTGLEPEPPLEPMLLCTEPTYEGLCVYFNVAHPSLGIFNDEGGGFTGGHGMKEENRLRMATGLSSLWDGSDLRRVRATDGHSLLCGRRLCIHLMMQLDIASKFLSDSALIDQGLLSRLLVCVPETTLGTRFQRDASQEAYQTLQRYNYRLLEILKFPMPLVNGKRNELCPRLLPMSDGAIGQWKRYANYAEYHLAKGQKFHPIRGLASKLAEHAHRIAAVLTLADNIHAENISEERFLQAVQISEYYASESLRLLDTGLISQELRDAELLREWLLTKWHEPYIGVRAICQYGPNKLRQTKKAKHTLSVLQDHYWIKLVPPNVLVDGQRVREVWLIRDKAAATPAASATQALSSNVAVVAA